LLKAWKEIFIFLGYIPRHTANFRRSYTTLVYCCRIPCRSILVIIAHICARFLMHRSSVFCDSDCTFFCLITCIKEATL
uniref:Ovule protein n=1 Tax=Brugia timori TaxID=42155 RepID=A0A0R3QLT0_9BILA